MSVKCMAAVWEHATAKGGERLLLLAVADYAKDDGTGAWPSLQRLCDKTKFSERNVRYLLRKLEELGELAIHQGAGPHGANLYTVTLVGWHPEPEAADRGAKFAGGAKIAPAKIAGGGQSLQLGGANFAGRGGKVCREGGQPVAPDPSVNRQFNHQDDPPEIVGGAVCGREVLDAPAPTPAHDPPPPPVAIVPVSDRGTAATRPRAPRTAPAPKPTAIPRDFALTDEMRDWAAAHAPDADLERETTRFIGRARESGKKSLDWLASWQAWMTNPYATKKPDPPPQGDAPRSPPTLLNDQPVNERMARNLAALRASKG